MSAHAKSASEQGQPRPNGAAPSPEFPDHLAPLWDKLPEEGQRACQGPWDTKFVSLRAYVKLALKSLRTAGWELKQAVLLAPYCPDGLGSLKGPLFTLILELWGELDRDDAERKQAEAEARRQANPLGIWNAGTYDYSKIPPRG